MKQISILIMLLLFIGCSSVTAQTHELGLRLNSLEDFNFIYKKEKNEATFVRYRFTNLQTLFSADLSNISMGFAIGWEKRKDVTEKLQFVHGWEPVASLQYTSAGEGTDTINTRVGVGYVLGFQYNFSESFYLNMEAIPTLSTLLVGFGNEFDLFTNFGFNTNAVALTAAYRFVPKKE